MERINGRTRRSGLPCELRELRELALQLGLLDEA